MIFYSDITVHSKLTIGVDDTGHDVKFYGATAGKYMLWDESANALVLPDATPISIGTGGGDLQIKHTGTNSEINNWTGDLYLTQNANNKDIIFQSDDGSGGVETYFFLDGSASSGKPFTVFPDNSQLVIGTGNDVLIYHDGSNSYITNKTGALKIATETSGIAITIGHTTSETTVADNLTITGDLVIGGDITSVGDDVSIGDDLYLTSVNGALRWNGTHGGSGGITYEDTGGSARYAMQFAQDTVIMSNRAANGTVAIKANTSTAGAAGEVTVATFTDTEMTCLATTVTGGMTVVESSEPSNPPAGSAVIWYAEGVLYAKNSDGTPGVVAAFEGG